MAEAIAFDTHRFVNRLTESGFTEKQTEALAEEHVALLNANLATKADIETLRQETKAGIEALRQETRASIEAVKADLVKWLFGALIAPRGPGQTALAERFSRRHRGSRIRACRQASCSF